MYETDHPSEMTSDMCKSFHEKTHEQKTSTEAILTRAKAAGAELLRPLESTENALIEPKLPDYFTPPAPRAIQIYINIGVVVPNSPLSHHIFLWVSCAKLFVDFLTKNLDSPPSFGLPIRINEEGPQIGSINLSPEWTKGQVLIYMDFFMPTLGYTARQIRFNMKSS